MTTLAAVQQGLISRVPARLVTSDVLPMITELTDVELRQAHEAFTWAVNQLQSAVADTPEDWNVAAEQILSAEQAVSAEMARRGLEPSSGGGKLLLGLGLMAAVGVGILFWTRKR